MIGMNAPMNTSDASGSASGTPRIASPAPMPMASTAATATVARTNPTSVPNPWLPASRTRSPRRRRDDPGDELPDLLTAVEEEDEREQRQQGAGEEFADHRGGGECAAGQRVLVVLDGLTTESPACRIWSSLRCSGPAGQPVLDLLDAGGELVGELRQTLDELLDDERHDARDHAERADQRRPPPAERGTPCRCIQSTSGDSSADASSAIRPE